MSYGIKIFITVVGFTFLPFFVISVLFYRFARSVIEYSMISHLDYIWAFIGLIVINIYVLLAVGAYWLFLLHQRKKIEQIVLRKHTLNATRHDLEKMKKKQLVMIRDLKKEKAKFEVAKAQDEAILQGMGDGLIVTDEKGKITMVNKSFENMLGWKASEVLGKKFTDVVLSRYENGKSISPSQRAITRVLQRSETVESMFYKAHYYLRKDKSAFPVDITLTPIVKNKKIRGAVEVFRDITYERNIDKMKTEFVSLVSHQLRTPLTSIKLFSEMLLSGQTGALNKQQKDFMGDVHTSADQMILLVNDLLNVSHLEAGRLKVDPKRIRVDTFVQEVIQEVVKGALPVSRKKKCSIHLKKSHERLTSINTDPTLLRQVVRNLLINATRYSPEKRCQVRVEIDLAKKTRDLILSIHDSGIGIPKEEQEKVFRKFFRAKNAQRATGSGTGLGLYMAKMIMDALGGKIWFTSRMGRGTTFYVSLPSEGIKQKQGDRNLVTNQIDNN